MHAMPYSTLCPTAAAAAAAVALPDTILAAFKTHSCVTRSYQCTGVCAPKHKHEQPVSYTRTVQLCLLLGLGLLYCQFYS